MKKGNSISNFQLKDHLDASIVHNNQSAPLYIEPSERIEISMLADDVFRSINYVSDNFNNHVFNSIQEKIRTPSKCR